MKIKNDLLIESYNLKVDVDKLVDYATRAFGSIYNAGKSFGRNWYNAFY